MKSLLKKNKKVVPRLSLQQAQDTLLDLQTARDAISVRGRWTQGSYNLLVSQGVSAHCTVGAVREYAKTNTVVPTVPTPFATPYLRALAVLADEIPATFEYRPDRWSDPGSKDVAQFVIAYNDHIKTYHKDVLAMFDRAIAALSARVDELKQPKPRMLNGLRVRAGLTGPGKTIVVTEEPVSVPDSPQEAPVEAPAEPQTVPAEPDKVPA